MEQATSANTAIRNPMSSSSPPVDESNAPATRNGPQPIKAKQAAASEVKRSKLKMLTAAAVPAAPAAFPVVECPLGSVHVVGLLAT